MSKSVLHTIHASTYEILNSDLLKSEVFDFCKNVDVVETTGSTNDDLKIKARQSAFQAPVFLSAKHQTHGRGTQGKVWNTVDKSLMFSMGFSTNQPLTGVIPILVGQVIAKACWQYQIPLKLKWPNDLWLAGGKVGGILCELVKDSFSKQSLIIGVGINLKGHPSTLTSNGWPTRDFYQYGAAEFVDSVTQTTLLVSQIFKNLHQYFTSYDLQQLTTIVCQNWPLYDVFFNSPVYWVDNQTGEFQSAQSYGLDEQGRLIVKHQDQLKVLLGELCAPTYLDASFAP